MPVLFALRAAAAASGRAGRVAGVVPARLLVTLLPLMTLPSGRVAFALMVSIMIFHSCILYYIATTQKKVPHPTLLLVLV